MDIRSSTIASDSKNIFNDVFSFFLNIENKPTAKAISVDIGMQIPFK